VWVGVMGCARPGVASGCARSHMRERSGDACVGVCVAFPGGQRRDPWDRMQGCRGGVTITGYRWWFHGHPWSRMGGREDGTPACRR